MEIIKSSLHLHKNEIYFILKFKGKRLLGILYKKNSPKNFAGKNIKLTDNNLLICPLSSKNAEAIRKIFPQCAPSCIKNKKFIFGFGYRSPYLVGNVMQARIVKNYPQVVPILGQQSKRELRRTGRSFEDVLNSATWATFEVNLNFWGADADHLKKPSDAKEPAKLGFTHFTIDPSEVLISAGKKEIKYKNVFPLISNFIKIIKKHIRGDFTLEISLDEHEGITSPEELRYILEELKRNKIKIDEIAPKFVGSFEKGIDYFSDIKGNKKIKNIKLFEKHFTSLYKIAKYYGVKLCLHSGSDKFSIYPTIKKITNGNIHIKTAGTFFLEELRLVTKTNPDEFKKIYNYALDVFEKEKASYKLTAKKEDIPDLSKLDGKEIYKLMETKNGNDSLRQVLHVSYGKILTHPKIKKVIEEAVILNENELFKIFSSHIRKHLRDF